MDGALQLSTRQQMAFIARKMVSKGWLAPESVPDLESLRVKLRGPARDVLFPPGAPAGAALEPSDAPDQPARFAAITSAAPAK
jgi:hypothetical protein